MILIIGGAYQGKYEYAIKQYGKDYQILNNYHKKVKEQLEYGKNPILEAKKWIDQEIVIISDELGYGIVPVDQFERGYRELNGRVNCYLAKHAQEVIRVICGIGTKIK